MRRKRAEPAAGEAAAGDSTAAAEIGRLKRQERAQLAQEKRQRLAAERQRLAAQAAAASVSRAQAAALEAKERERQRARRREEKATKDQRAVLKGMLPALRETTDQLALAGQLCNMIAMTAESAVHDETLSGKELRAELRQIGRSVQGLIPAARLLAVEDLMQRSNDRMNSHEREVVLHPVSPDDDGAPLQLPPRDAS